MSENHPLAQQVVSKVPEITLLFWVLKILATTLGETGGDAVSMSLDLGYLVGTAIFAALFVVAAGFQLRADGFRPWIYWATILATTTVGTTLADFCDRDLGVGYAGGSALLLLLLMASLAAWKRALGSVAIATVSSPKAEAFYWITILFSQTLGTALGDWTADSAGIGYVGSTAIFGGALALLALAAAATKVSRTALFWVAFILTRPLGAVVGDLLDKPLGSGGLEFSRFAISGLLVAVIGILIATVPQRAPRGSAARH
jgi:uncharacterized membrane-anchored protein